MINRTTRTAKKDNLPLTLRISKKNMKKKMKKDFENVYIKYFFNESRKHMA